MKWPNSEWLPCIRRQEITLNGPPVNGRTGAIQKCAHPSCSMFTKEITPEDCAGCPLRVAMHGLRPGMIQLQIVQRDFEQPKLGKDGELTYPRTGWEPPVCPEGYVRKSEDYKSDDAWVFLPQWLPCQDRENVNSVRPCGCIQIHAICVSKQSGREGEPVGVNACHGCPVRRP